MPYMLTSKHVLAFAIEDDGTGLELLAAEELGESDRFGLRRAGNNGPGLTGGRAMLMLVLVLVLVLVAVFRRWSSPLLLLLLLLHLSHHHLLMLSLELLDKLGNGHASLLGINGKLSLDRLDLLGRGHLARRRHGHLPWARLRRTLFHSGRALSVFCDNFNLVWQSEATIVVSRGSAIPCCTGFGRVVVDRKMPAVH